MLCHLMLCPGIDFSACWAYLDPTGGWCSVKGCPGILLGHLFNMKPLQKELPGDGFALNSNPFSTAKTALARTSISAKAFANPQSHSDPKARLLSFAPMSLLNC